MLGQRDHLYPRQTGVPTIAGQVPLHPLEELRGDPTRIAADAAQYLVRHAHRWWLHIDLDVLAGSEFPACDAAAARRPGDAPVTYAGSSGPLPGDPLPIQAERVLRASSRPVTSSRVPTPVPLTNCP